MKVAVELTGKIREDIKTLIRINDEKEMLIDHIPSLTHVIGQLLSSSKESPETRAAIELNAERALLNLGKTVVELMERNGLEQSRQEIA